MPIAPDFSRSRALWWHRVVTLILLLIVFAAAGCSSAPRAKSSAPIVGWTSPLRQLLVSQEQTDHEIVPSKDIARVMVTRDSFTGSSPVPGSEHAFTVGGSPMVGTADKSTKTVVP